MGNYHFNPCPVEPNVIELYPTSELIGTHNSILSESLSVKYFKHSIEIQGPSEVYKKSLRKDLKTVYLAEEILLSFDMDRCFIKDDCESIIMTKTTYDSTSKRYVSLYPKKTINRKKSKLLLGQVSG